MRHLLPVLIAVVVLSGCATSVMVSDDTQASDGDPLRHWSNVLETYVNKKGAVDFRGLFRDPKDLHAFVTYLATISPDSAPLRFPTRESRIAYHINAYNALAMYSVIDSGIPKFLSGPNKVSFFVSRKLKIGGRELSLEDYENDVIRPMGEERVHFALNHMVVSCPRLRRVPFTAENLDRELDREARRFFAEPRNLQVHHGRKVVHLSAILKLYEEDFLATSPTLITYVNRYVEEPIPEGYQMEFLDYDWTVNDQARG